MGKKNRVLKTGVFAALLVLILAMSLLPAIAQENYTPAGPEFVTVQQYNPVSGEMDDVQLHPVEAEALAEFQSKEPYRPELISLFGKLPEFSSEAEKLSLVNGTYRDLNSKVKLDSKWMYPEGPVIAYGESITGTLFVGINHDTTIEDEMMKEIYQAFRTQGEELGISNAPLEFRYMGGVEGDRTQPRRPVFGGVQVGDPYDRYSTLGFSAWRGTQKGVVVSGHAYQLLDWSVYQPEKWQRIGDVKRLAGNYADASWVVASVDVTPKIYVELEFWRNVGDYGDPLIGLYVYKSGISTGVTYGQVVDRTTIWNKDLGRWMNDQYIATYNRASGDSGAPVYTVPSGSQYGVIRGIHSGVADGYAVFSPVSGVSRDLGAYPMTMS